MSLLHLLLLLAMPVVVVVVVEGLTLVQMCERALHSRKTRVCLLAGATL